MTSLISSAPLARALTERNYDKLTPVQTAVIAADATGRDLLVSAQTGSGKTVAYGLAIAKDLLGDAERFERAGAPVALIVAPTRELALQVQRELSWLYQYANARVVSCVGGMDPQRERRELADGAHIVVGTPGRLCDHLRRGRLDVSQLKAVVLDEADEMLDLGFREDMEFILKTTPATRRTLLFSATLPRGIVALAKQYQQQAFRVEVAGDEGGHADIEYRAIRVAPGDIEHAVVNVLRFFESPSALVFCNTRAAVNHLQTALLERGFSVVALSGELTQNERTHALQALRDGRARVCVATDVAARGIDLPNLDLVVHADLPNDAEVMQHRSGRTGRARRKGVSVLLVPPARRRRAELLLNLASIDAVWGTAPTADEIRKLDQERMLQDALFSQESTPQDLELARAMLAERSAEDIAAALARLYRERLPSPEDILDPGQSNSRSRDDRGREKEGRPSRERDRSSEPRPKSGKSSPRHVMEGGVWFRAAIGRRKNAEARWLLPMICRRGGIDKNDIGAIRIMDTTTEFEISKEAAESFALKIRRPDKEDNIRIELLANASQDETLSEKPAYAPRRDDKETSRDARPQDKFRDERGPKTQNKPSFAKPAYDKPSYEKREKPSYDKPHQGKSYEGKSREGKPYAGKSDKPYAGKPRRDDGADFSKPPSFEKKKFRDKPAHGHPPRPAGAPGNKPAFGKKKANKHRQ